MSAIRSLSERLQAIRSEHARHDDRDQRGSHSGLGGFGQPSLATRARPARSVWDEEDRHGAGGGGGGGGRFAPARRERKRLADGATRISGLAGGGQKAVVKVVSFASGGARVGALASYVTKEREGGVATEDQDGLALDGAAVAEKLERWRQGYSERQPSKDVATVRFEITGRPELDAATVQAGIGRSFEGHRFALRVERAGEGGFEVAAVVAAAADPAVTVAGAKAQPRFKFDKSFEASLAAGISGELGAEVQAQVLGTGHGREGVVHRLSRLVAGAAAHDEQVRELSTVVDVRAAADTWRKGLGSRQARDAMHFVVSAKAGTDPDAFKSTARELLASEFAGHEYLFAVHNDRGHLHAHAVILVKGEDGQRIRPDISTFAAWRSRYAEIAESYGIRMVATRRSDTASAPAFSQGEAALTDRGVAPDHIRRKVAAKRTDAIHVPVREEGRARAVQAHQNWKALETTSETPQARSAACEQLTRLATAVNVSHGAAARADQPRDMQERGAAMARATSEYLTAEFKRANDVLNRALPLLEGADKVEATERANAYLASLAKQVEAVEAVERGHVVERVHGIRVREEREAADATGEARALRAAAIDAGRPRGAETSPDTAREPEAEMLEDAARRAERVAGRERSEAMARQEQTLRANPTARVLIDPNLPPAGEELREEHELLVDRLEAQKLTHTRVHRR